MKQPLVSIILPTYNMERFLQECLESINRQTYKKIEVIIIIDGATDSSYEIAKEYCASHSNFSVYWQDNQGSGPARNNGLRHATGELVIFVDPDDWCEPTYVEEMVLAQRQGDFDLTVSRDKVVHFNEDGSMKEIATSPLDSTTVTDINKVRTDYVMLLESNLIRAPHGKIYKMSIIKEYSILFPALRRSQDIAFNYLYYTHINNYCTCSVQGYVYRVLTNSIHSKLNPQYFETISVLYRGINNMYKQWGYNYDKTRVANYFYSVLYNCFCIFKSNRHFVKSVISEGTLREIVITAKPSRIDRVFARFLIRNNSYLFASLFFRIMSLFYK